MRLPLKKPPSGGFFHGGFSLPCPVLFAFRNLFLLNKQANRPHRPSILRSALSNQEKTVDNLAPRACFSAAFPPGWRAFRAFAFACSGRLRPV
ncbi:MAG: hypothetical protein ACTTJV_08815 [Ottowia sp.]